MIKLLMKWKRASWILKDQSSVFSKTDWSAVWDACQWKKQQKTEGLLQGAFAVFFVFFFAAGFLSGFFLVFLLGFFFVFFFAASFLLGFFLVFLSGFKQKKPWICAGRCDRRGPGYVRRHFYVMLILHFWLTGLNPAAVISRAKNKNHQNHKPVDCQRSARH